MSTFSRIVILISIIILTGCSSFLKETTPVVYNKPDFEYSNPAPLYFKPVKWKILKVDGISYYSLDFDNYSNLLIMLEQSQNRLYFYNTNISVMKEYYQN